MTLPKKMRLTVAAFIASVTLGEAMPVQAQFTFEPNDLRRPDASSSVVVNLKAQAIPSAGANLQRSSAQASSAANSTAPSAASDTASSRQNPASQPAPDRALQIVPETQGVVGQAPRVLPGDGGRLAPIAMESVRAPISAANISVEDIGTKLIPLDEAAKEVAAILPLPNGEDRALSYLTYRWQSANICHWPLYFEEPMLERHGQQICPTYLQPAVSGTKFFSNILLYPYKATLQPALESRYTLGHFRPGSPAPLLKDTLPWSPRAAAVQGMATAGVFVGLPW